MGFRSALPILAGAALAAGCASRPFATSLQTGLPPGNAGDVAVAASGRFAASMNGPDGSLSVFPLVVRDGAVDMEDYPGVRPWSVDLAGSGVPERIAFAPGIATSDALHALVRDPQSGRASIRRVYASGRTSLGVDEAIAEDPSAEQIADAFDDASPVTEDDRLRIREEVRRRREEGVAAFAGTDDLADAAAWENRGRRWVFATLEGGDSVLCFETTSRGQAALRSVLPCGAPRGLAVDAERGLLFVADVRAARIAVFDLRSRRAGLR